MSNLVAFVALSLNNMFSYFSPFSPTGVGSLWLCVCERERDTGLHECPGHLQLWAPQCPPGADRVGAQTPPPSGTVRQQPELHQGLEGTHSSWPQVGRTHPHTKHGVHCCFRADVSFTEFELHLRLPHSCFDRLSCVVYVKSYVTCCGGGIWGELL